MTKKKSKIINVEAGDDLEKIEEDIIKAADKAGKRNVIVNIFSTPHKKLKRRWKIRYKFNKKHLVFDLAIAGMIMVLIGLNVFWLYGGFHYFTNKLDIEISANTESFVSGQDIVFSVQYANNNKYELEDVVLSFKYPDYFVLNEVSREEFVPEKNIVRLGNLEPGANGHVEVLGQLIGNFQEEQVLLANFNFYKTNKKGERLWGQFRKNVPYQYLIEDSYLQVETELPEVLVNKQIFDWSIKISNTSENINYEEVQLMIQEDGEFQLLEQSDDLATSLNPGESREFNIKARFNTAKESKDVKFGVIWKSSTFALLQNSWSKEQKVILPKFEVSHQVQVVDAVSPGDDVEVTVGFDNAGDYTIENAEITLELLGDYWNLNKVQNGTGKVFGNKVTWTVAEMPKLALIQPKEKNEFSFTVGTDSYVSGSQDLDLRSRMTIKYKLEGQNVYTTTPYKTTKLNSNLAVSAYPMYFAKTGDQLGRGPIPPRVGSETKYWMFMRMVNDIHDVENVTVTAELPFNVTWVNESNVPVGDAIEYSHETKTISWQISKVPVKPTNIGFAFVVSIIPTTSQVGSYPILLNNIQVKGIDKITGLPINKNLGSINTSLIYDAKGKQKDGPVR
jgi:hypothetical protein